MDLSTKIQEAFENLPYLKRLNKKKPFGWISVILSIPKRKVCSATKREDRLYLSVKMLEITQNPEFFQQLKKTSNLDEMMAVLCKYCRIHGLDPAKNFRLDRNVEAL